MKSPDFASGITDILKNPKSLLVYGIVALTISACAPGNISLLNCNLPGSPDSAEITVNMTNGNTVEVNNLGSFRIQADSGEDESLIFEPEHKNLEIQAIGANQLVTAYGNTAYTVTLEGGNLNVQGACQ